MSTEFNQTIHFVTGKGGVGKSFFAASFAAALSQSSKQNQPILLAELNDRSFYRDYLGLEEVSYQPRPINKGFGCDLAMWSGHECLKEYALHLLKIESLYKLFFENPISRALIEVSPGLHELAILGKATSAPRKHGPPLKYKNIVIDAFSTGHFLTMMRSPKALAETIQFGPMGEQSRTIDKCIRNAEFSKVHIICLPEELPATETVELYKQLQLEFGITAQVYMNKYFQIAEADLISEQTDVQLHFKHLLEQQKLALEILKSAQINFLKIPFIPENDNIKLVNLTAAQLSNLMSMGEK